MRYIYHPNRRQPIPAPPPKQERVPEWAENLGTLFKGGKTFMKFAEFKTDYDKGKIIDKQYFTRPEWTFNYENMGAESQPLNILTPKSSGGYFDYLFGNFRETVEIRPNLKGTKIQSHPFVPDEWVQEGAIWDDDKFAEYFKITGMDEDDISHFTGKQFQDNQWTNIPTKIKKKRIEVKEEIKTEIKKEEPNTKIINESLDKLQLKEELPPESNISESDWVKHIERPKHPGFPEVESEDVFFDEDINIPKSKRIKDFKKFKLKKPKDERFFNKLFKPGETIKGKDKLTTPFMTDKYSQTMGADPLMFNAYNVEGGGLLPGEDRSVGLWDTNLKPSRRWISRDDKELSKSSYNSFLKGTPTKKGDLFSNFLQPGEAQGPGKQALKALGQTKGAGGPGFFKALFNPAAGANTGLMAGMGPLGWTMMGVGLLSELKDLFDW